VRGPQHGVATVSGLLLVGASGLAREATGVAVWLHRQGPISIVDDDPATWGTLHGLTPVLGSVDPTVVARVDQGRGVIILTDLFGGTPSNLAISLMESGRIEVIAGVNLPMLIRLEGARRTMSVVAAVAAAREAGRKYISVASEVLGEAAA